MRTVPFPTLPGASPDEQVARELSEVFSELLRRRIAWYQSVGNTFGLSLFQMGAMFHLYFEDAPAKMSEVAIAAGCAPSNLTGVVDKLEARGLVKRHAATEDRRIKMVSLTEAGTALITEFITRFAEPAPWMLALSTDDQRQLRDLLRLGLAHEQPSFSPMLGLNAETCAAEE